MPQPVFSGDATRSVIASGSVTGGSGVSPIVGGLKMVGIAPSTGAPGQSIVHVGAGIYTIQLPAGNIVDKTVGRIDIMPEGAALANISFHVVTWTAAGLITLSSVLASSAIPIVPTDSDFSFTVWRMGPP